MVASTPVRPRILGYQRFSITAELLGILGCLKLSFDTQHASPLANFRPDPETSFILRSVKVGRVEEGDRGVELDKDDGTIRLMKDSSFDLLVVAAAY